MSNTTQLSGYRANWSERYSMLQSLYKKAVNNYAAIKKSGGIDSDRKTLGVLHSIIFDRKQAS